ncbi:MULTISPECIES: DUF2510 domain-containing protein [unclassified Aeromicrobium]|uniref:DUF2510 domain-containing protein n=1 Tax=unclassified Aeromicrobium TaxID=2633570 RepID=UPI00288A531A|nr:MULTISPECIES: DUF2510 domain-containing protein [unclassified Aeromicrobium]
MSEQVPVAGWYPVDDLTERYWNGESWSEETRPRAAGPSTPTSATAGLQQSTSSGSPALLKAVVLAGAVIGLVMSMQSASLLTGTGMLWTGAAIAVGATIVAFAMKADRWVKVVAALAMVVAVANVMVVESQLEDMRQDLSDLTDF